MGNQSRDWNPKRFRGAIFDVGMHDGSDTESYLRQGYAVLAVEADPTLTAAAARRFDGAIRGGQLQIVNAGISETSGTATFWICDDNSVWNSFDIRIASRNTSRHHPIDVPTCRFADLLSTFGVPEYLKVDIEGADHLCVKDIDPGRLPRFISVECECVGDGETLTPDESVRMLDLLREVGYTKFKLVSQDDFMTASDPDRWRLARRVVDSLSSGKLAKLGLRKIATRFSTRGRLRALNGGCDFKCGSTGPWGTGLLGRWSPYDEARALYLQLRERFFARADAKTYAFWYDWHATS